MNNNNKKYIDVSSFNTVSDGVLRIGAYAGFAPFAQKNEASRDGWSGWDIDFLRGFAGSLGLETQVVETPHFDGVWNLPANFVCDIAATGITATKARREYNKDIAWSRSYFKVQRAFVTKTEDAAGFTGAKVLEGKKIIVTKSSLAHYDVLHQIEAAGVSAVDIEFTDDETEAALRVLHGEAFAYGGGIASIRYLADTIPGLSEAWVHETFKSSDTAEDLGAEVFSFTLRKKDAPLLALLDRYIESYGHTYAGIKA